MRQAMANAEVGDDVYGEDPTINRLEELGATMLGKEAGLFVPSGTMGNQICILTHTNGRSEEVILEEEAHIYVYEVAGMAVLAGCSVKTLPAPHGQLDPAAVGDAIRADNIHFPRTRLLCLENTHNRAGGTVMSVSRTQALSDVARSAGVAVHLDGARLFNAATALGVSAAELAGPVDSVQFCLSKGLSAPVGSLVVGSKPFIGEARRMRKLLGGGMRQAGVIAAAGIVALTEMVERLVEDHEHARQLGEAIAEMSPFSIDLETVQTNIVAFNVDPAFGTAPEVLDALQRFGVRANPVRPERIRMVTHAEISREDISRAIDALQETVRQGV